MHHKAENELAARIEELSADAIAKELAAELKRETRNILIDKILKAYEVETNDVADYVELFYDCQRLRIQHANKERTEGVGPLKSWFAFWLRLGESVIASKLDQWVRSTSSPQEAKWAYSQVGIGSIIAAGLAAHIDPEKARTPSSIWKFAGLAPGSDRRVKGQKLPYNSRLKVLCWKLGESFVKVSGKEGATYGHWYADFKAQEIKRNEQGFYKEAAVKELANKKFRDDTATLKRLKGGMLSDAHLHARAKRRAVKLFLSHYYVIAREARGLEIRKPYSETVLGHDGIIKPIE
jgi:hypothetical protein